MANQKTVLTTGEQIDRARDGRSQSSIIVKMQARGCDIDDVRFSRKKKGWEEFTEDELKILSEILGTKIG